MGTIAIFGATRKTGGRLLDRVRAAEYDVRVLVRDPDKLPPSTHGNSRSRLVPLTQVSDRTFLHQMPFVSN